MALRQGLPVHLVGHQHLVPHGALHGNALAITVLRLERHVHYSRLEPRILKDVPERRPAPQRGAYQVSAHLVAYALQRDEPLDGRKTDQLLVCQRLWPLHQACYLQAPALGVDHRVDEVLRDNVELLVRRHLGRQHASDPEAATIGHLRPGPVQQELPSHGQRGHGGRPYHRLSKHGAPSVIDGIAGARRLAEKGG